MRLQRRILRNRKEGDSADGLVPSLMRNGVGQVVQRSGRMVCCGRPGTQDGIGDVFQCVGFDLEGVWISKNNDLERICGLDEEHNRGLQYNSDEGSPRLLTYEPKARLTHPVPIPIRFLGA